MATIEITEATPNSPSHVNRTGIRCPKTTRFAGLEMGSTKLAAFAMNAQMKRKGKGGALACRAAA